jgi:hypothetical protein
MADQYEGQGGSYIIENGVRRLVHRTEDHPGGNRPRDAEGRPLDPVTGQPLEAAPAVSPAADGAQ